jgi:membrane associated rhomboid family serine protease
MVVSALFTPQSVTVGASGALFGLLGAYLAELITNCHLLSRKDACCAFFSLMMSILINLAIGLLPVSAAT